MLGQLLQAEYRHQEHRAARDAAEYALTEAAARVAALEARYVQAQYLVATLAAAGDERNKQ